MWTVLEVLAVAMIATGTWLALGLGWGLVAGGALLLWLSWMAGGEEL